MSATPLFEIRQVCVVLIATAILLLNSTGWVSAKSDSDARYKITVRLQAADGIHPPSPIIVRTDRKVCGEKRGPQSLVINQQRDLKNVVVWIEGHAAHAWAPSTPNQSRIEVIREENCEFTPRIVVIPPDGSVSFLNRDSVLHGIRTKGQANRPTNRAHPPNLNEIKLKFSTPEIIPIACDFHPWEKAFVVVAPHADYGVTDESGTYEFKNLAPGSYQIKAWHEVLGMRSPFENVTISDRDIRLNLTFGLTAAEKSDESVKRQDKKRK